MQQGLVRRRGRDVSPHRSARLRRTEAALPRARRPCRRLWLLGPLPLQAGVGVPEDRRQGSRHGLRLRRPGRDQVVDSAPEGELRLSGEARPGPGGDQGRRCAGPFGQRPAPRRAGPRLRCGAPHGGPRPGGLRAGPVIQATQDQGPRRAAGPAPGGTQGSLPHLLPRRRGREVQAAAGGAVPRAGRARRSDGPGLPRPVAADEAAAGRRLPLAAGPRLRAGRRRALPQALRADREGDGRDRRGAPEVSHARALTMTRAGDTLDVRIYYQDTDCGGVVYYGNYLRYFEQGRTHWLETRGSSVKAFIDGGILLAVVHAEVHYRSPARYGATLAIATRLAACRGASFTFAHESREERRGRPVEGGAARPVVVDTQGQ